MVSLLVTLYAVEALLGVLVPEPSVSTECSRMHIERDKCIAAVASGAPFDTRSRVELIRSLEAQGDTVWPSFNSWELNLRNDTILIGGRAVQPLAGISRVSTLYCNERGEYVRFHADEFGFRNPPELHARPVQHALIGDSFVQGYCVPDDSTLAGHLRAVYPRTLNLGRDGHGPLSHLAVLREYAARVKPETVLWFFFEGNDLHDLEIEKNREPLARYLVSNHSAQLAHQVDSLDRQLQIIVQTKRRAAEERSRLPRASREDQYGITGFITLARLRELAHRALTRPSRDHPMDHQLFRRVLELAATETAGWGGRLIFVYLPSWERFADAELANPHRDSVLSIVQSLNIPVIDITPAFRNVSDPLALFPFGISGHYEPEGYQLVAQQIGQYFQRASP